MPYVNQRWLGGLLTNFHTMSARIDRLHELTALKEEGQLGLLPTKERMAREAELAKLEYNLGGVRNMKRLPQAALIIDLKTEAIAVREAERLRIPIIGLVDSNVDPVPVDYPIPGNDDSIRSCELVIAPIGEAVYEAAQAWREAEAKRQAEEEERRRREAEERQRREAEERARKEAEEAQAAAEAAEAEPRAGEEAPADARRALAPERDREQWMRRCAVGRRCQGAPRAHRRRDHGLQGRPGRGRRRHGEGDRDPARQGPGVGRQAQRPEPPSEGLVASYIHATGKVGVLVEVQCETDFVARSDEFREFAREVAIHIAGAPSPPRYVSVEEIPDEVRDAERAGVRGQGA